MKKVFQCLLVSLCYWFIIFIGPAIVLLWNNLSYYVSGLGYGSESLMYKILTFLSQPISCIFAAGLAGNLFDGKHRLCALVNCVIAACYCSASVFQYLFFVDNASMLAVMAISAVICIVTAALQANEFANTGKVDELEKLKSENVKLQTELCDQNYASYVFNLLAEKTGATTTALADSLFVNYYLSIGYTSESAEIELQKEKQNWNQRK